MTKRREHLSVELDDGYNDSLSMARCDTLEVKSGGSCNRPYKLLEVDDVNSSLENKHSNNPALISEITKP